MENFKIFLFKELTMKNKIKVLGFIALAAIIGFSMTVSLTGCENPADSKDQTPTVADYDIGNLTQTAGSVTAVSITPKQGKSGGKITVYYEGTGSATYPKSTTLPTAAGTYIVTFDVAAVTGFTAAYGLSAGNLVVNPADGGDDGTTTVPVIGVTLNQNSLSLNMGETATLTAVVVPDNATNKAVTWSTSDAAKATVANGIVTAVAAGTATIIVTTADGNKTAECSVDINDPSLSTLSGTITISPSTIIVNTELTAAYSGSENVSFQWKKDGSNIGTASTTNPNKYTPTEAGIYTVTISLAGYNNKTSNEAIAHAAGTTLSGITITQQPTKTTYSIGEALDTAGMVVTATYSDGTTQPVTGYTTDFSSVTAGQKTVTVTYETKTATFTITVNENTGGGTKPTITTTSLPNGTVGTAYNQTVEATGDTPITWSIDGGTLPTGLTLNATTGVIAGTPTTATTSTFTVKAINAAGNVKKQLSITIAPTGSLSNLSGYFALYSPANIFTGMTMTAEYYNGTETVSFQWKKDGVNVGTASTTNPNKFTPTTAGKYTVTVSATGFNSKTSDEVTVTALAAGYEIMYYAVLDMYTLNDIKAGDQELFDEFVYNTYDIKFDTINKTIGKTINVNGNGIMVILVPVSLGELKAVRWNSGTNYINSTYPAVSMIKRTNVTFNGIEYYLYYEDRNSSQSYTTDWNWTLEYDLPLEKHTMYYGVVSQYDIPYLKGEHGTEEAQEAFDDNLEMETSVGSGVKCLIETTIDSSGKYLWFFGNGVRVIFVPVSLSEPVAIRDALGMPTSYSKTSVTFNGIEYYLYYGSTNGFQGSSGTQLYQWITYK
jgi:uncharacterized protein YjdB